MKRADCGARNFQKAMNITRAQCAKETPWFENTVVVNAVLIGQLLLGVVSRGQLMLAGHIRAAITGVANIALKRWSPPQSQRRQADESA